MPERRRAVLTEEVGEQLRLVVVYDGHAQRVEPHQTQDGPVEGLRLHDVADEEAESALLLVEGGALLATLDAGAGKGRTYEGRGRDRKSGT